MSGLPEIEVEDWKKNTEYSSGYDEDTPVIYYETHRTQLANIMDINPNWSIHTFLQYVDAVVSPPPGTKKKVLSMKSRSVSDAEDLSRLALGELLGQQLSFRIAPIKRHSPGEQFKFLPSFLSHYFCLEVQPTWFNCSSGRRY